MRVSDRREAKGLAAPWNKAAALDAVCADDPWRVGRVLSSGTDRLCVAFVYSAVKRFREAAGLGAHADIDMVYWYEGILVPYRRKAVERALDRALAGGAGPVGLDGDARARILEAAGGRCWACGRVHPDGLYVQDIFPYARPEFERRDGKFVPSSPLWKPEPCAALCPDCAAEWRRCFDLCIREPDCRWIERHGFRGLDIVIQGGYVGPEGEALLGRLKSFVTACVENHGWDGERRPY